MQMGKLRQLPRNSPSLARTRTSLFLFEPRVKTLSSILERIRCFSRIQGNFDDMFIEEKN